MGVQGLEAAFSVQPQELERQGVVHNVGQQAPRGGAPSGVPPALGPEPGGIPMESFENGGNQKNVQNREVRKYEDRTIPHPLLTINHEKRHVWGATEWLRIF